MKSTTRKRSRVQKACEFCKLRKMKCNNEQPQCSSCRTHGQECLYVDKPKKARPSNLRISHLEEENRRLQSRLTENVQPSSGTTSPTQLDDGPESFASASLTPLGNQESSPDPDGKLERDLSTAETDEAALRCLTSNPGELEFHGPSSAYFDSVVPNGQVPRKRLSKRRLPSSWVKKSLLAEAAHQRKLHFSCNTWLKSNLFPSFGRATRTNPSLIRRT